MGASAADGVVVYAKDNVYGGEVVPRQLVKHRPMVAGVNRGESR